MSKKIKKKTTDALQILERLTGNNPGIRHRLRQAELNAEVAQLIYDARIKAGLTQKQLAEKIGTRQPVIARLEDADYEGHSLSMLQRIAEALNQRLDIHMTPLKKAI